MAGDGTEGLKTLTYAYKDISVEQYEEIMNSHDQESEDFRAMLETDLVYIGTFGLEDPLRTNIKDSVSYIKYG